MDAVVALKWQVIDKYVARSECERYRLIKGYIGGTVRYVPYYVEGDRRDMLSNGVMTAEAAKTICETHNKAKHGIRQSEPIRPAKTAPGVTEGSDAEKGKGTPGN